MITKRNLRLISGFIDAQSFKRSLDTSAYSIIQNQLDNAIIASKQLASQISYRSDRFTPYVDTKVNKFFSSTMLLTIMFSKITSFLDFINPSLKLLDTTVGDAGSGITKCDLKDVVAAVDNAVNIDNFKILADKLSKVTADDITFTCNQILSNKKCDDYTRIYMSMFILVAHKIKNSNNAYERQDVIDLSSEVSKILLIKSYDCLEQISFSELMVHHTFVPLFNLIVTHVHNMNDLIHKPIWDDDDDFIKYSKYVTIYDECLKCIKDFHSHLDLYIEQCYITTKNLDGYVKLLHLNALIKRSNLQDFGIFDSFYKTKMKDCLPDIDIKYLSYSTDIINKLSVLSFNDTFDYTKLKQLAEKALKQAKDDCLTYDDISYSIGTYWYRDTTNGKYQLCKAFINDSMTQTSHHGQFYTVKCSDGKSETTRDYLVKSQKIIQKKTASGFKLLCDSQEKCYHAMKLDGFGKYIESSQKIIFNGDRNTLNLFFEKIRNSRLIKTFQYSDQRKTSIDIDYVSDTLSIRYLEFPNTPDFNRGYDLTGLLPVSTVLTQPRYRVIEAGSVMGVSGSTISILPTDETLKFLMTKLIDDINIEIDQKKVNDDAQQCIKRILDDLVTGEEVSLSTELYDDFSKQFTPKIDLFKDIFSKDYVYLEKDFYDPTETGSNFVVTHGEQRIKKICPVILTQKMLLNHTHDMTFTGKIKRYSFGFNRIKGHLITSQDFEPKPEDRKMHATYVLRVDPDLFSFSSKSSNESYEYTSGKVTKSSHRKRVYFSGGNMEEVLRHTKDLTYYINADKLDRKNPHMELLNMIAYITTTQWWSDTYAKMLVNSAPAIIETLKNLLTHRPVFLGDTYYNYAKGSTANKINTIIDGSGDDRSKIIKLSAYLNSVMFDIKVAFADIDYVLDAVELYKKFSVQGEPISTFNMTHNINTVFDAPQFNIWDVIDLSNLDRFKGKLTDIPAVDYTLFAVQTTSEMRPLLYPSSDCPVKKIIEKATIAGYEYAVLSLHKQNRILDLDEE